MPDDPKPAHTAGQIRLESEPWSDDLEVYLWSVDGDVQVGSASPHDVPVEVRNANARRLVALWNSCQALSTEALEANVIERMVDMLGRVRATYHLEVLIEDIDALIVEAVGRDR